MAYQTTIRGEQFSFADLREVFARANEEKSGDRLAGLAARSERERVAAKSALADVPVVVFTGREISAGEDAQLHTMARSIVVKGVESPERLLDETALFLHRVFRDLPAEKQRMLERLNSSDED